MREPPRPSVLISGASTGIGRCIVDLLVEKGYRVFAGVRKEQDAEELRHSAGELVEPLMLDVTRETDIEKAVQRVSDACRNDGLSGLINNAGIAVPGALEGVPMTDVQKQMDVNLFGVIRLTQSFLPLIRRAAAGNGFARIVNVGSIGGRNAYPFMGLYNSSKFALAGLSESWRYELAPANIHVALLEPGAVATPIWDKGDADYERAITGLSDEHKQLYEKPMSRFRKMMQAVAEKGIPPEAVARAALHALESRKPNNRYLIGREARIVALLVRFLPDNWRFRLIRGQLKF